MPSVAIEIFDGRRRSSPRGTHTTRCEKQVQRVHLNLYSRRLYATGLATRTFATAVGIEWKRLRTRFGLEFILGNQAVSVTSKRKAESGKLAYFCATRCNIEKACLPVEAVTWVDPPPNLPCVVRGQVPVVPEFHRPGFSPWAFS